VQLRRLVVDAAGQFRTGGVAIPLSLKLSLDDVANTPVRQDLLIIDPTTPALIVNGRATMNCMVSECTMNERKFCLNVASSETDSELLPTHSESITIM
jgi:hypothetical protein